MPSTSCKFDGDSFVSSSAIRFDTASSALATTTTGWWAILLSVAASNFAGAVAGKLLLVIGFLFVMLGFRWLMVLTPSMRTPRTSTQPVANRSASQTNRASALWTISLAGQNASNKAICQHNGHFTFGRFTDSLRSSSPELKKNNILHCHTTALSRPKRTSNIELKDFRNTTRE